MVPSPFSLINIEININAIMNFEEVKTALDGLNTTGALNKEEVQVLREAAGELGFPFPNCNCSSKYTELLSKMKAFVRGRKGFPLYDWVSTVNTAVMLDGRCVSRYNYTDDDAAEFIRRFPEQKEFRRNGRPSEEQQAETVEAVEAVTEPTPVEKKKRAAATTKKRTGK